MPKNKVSPHVEALCSAAEAAMRLPRQPFVTATAKAMQITAKHLAAADRDSQDEAERRQAIREMGVLAKRPKLAAKLIKEGVSEAEALKRFRGAEEAKRAAIAASWDAAIARVNGEKPEAAPLKHGWDAAIALVSDEPEFRGRTRR